VTALLPEGFAVELEPNTRQLDAEWLFGGARGRALRLSASGRHAWQELRRGLIRSDAATRLARGLTDINAAQLGRYLTQFAAPLLCISASDEYRPRADWAPSR
jgi:hypothetical protein